MSDTVNNPDSDPVNHPDHYTWHPVTQVHGIECIDIIEEFSHNIAAAMGYLWRAGHKDNTIQDYRKAAWHIKREIQRLEDSHSVNTEYRIRTRHSG